MLKRLTILDADVIDPKLWMRPELAMVLVSGFGDLFAGYRYPFFCYAPQIYVMCPFLPSATKLPRLCFYTCVSVHGGGRSTSVHAGIPSPREQAHPPGTHTPQSGHPQADTPSRRLLLQTVHILLQCILVCNVPLKYCNAPVYYKKRWAHYENRKASKVPWKPKLLLIPNMLWIGTVFKFVSQ